MAVIRARAVGNIAKWMTAKIRRAAMLRAVRNRAILRIMVSVRRSQRRPSPHDDNKKTKNPHNAGAIPRNAVPYERAGHEPRELQI